MCSSHVLSLRSKRKPSLGKVQVSSFCSLVWESLQMSDRWLKTCSQPCSKWPAFSSNVLFKEVAGTCRMLPMPFHQAAVSGLWGKHNRGNLWNLHGCHHSVKGKSTPPHTHTVSSPTEMYLSHLSKSRKRSCLTSEFGSEDRHRHSEDCKQSELSNVMSDSKGFLWVSVGHREEILEKNAISRTLVKMTLGLKNAHKHIGSLMGSTRTNSAEATVPSKSTLTILACSGWTGVRDLSRCSLSWLQNANMLWGAGREEGNLICYLYRDRKLGFYK